MLFRRYSLIFLLSLCNLTIFGSIKLIDSIEIKIDSLIGRMTLKEKIGQMSQIRGDLPKDSLLQLIEAGEVGSIINAEGVENVNLYQQCAVKKSRLGIPLVIGRDVIHGYHTIFPIPLAQAATFDPEIVKSGARIAAIEASANGIRWTFSPMIDISRDPRWGRIAESFGEDPYLTSVMGVAMVDGYQGNIMSDSTSIAATAKHFFGYGASEGGKDYNTTNLADRLLRNIYLKPFEAVTNAGVATFMTSFNENDGIPASANKYMLRNVLRDEWKFRGFVVSDWESITQMVEHRFCTNHYQAAEKAINAGVDMEMVSNSYMGNADELIKNKKLDVRTIDESVRNILRIKYQLGLFQRPYTPVKVSNFQGDSKRYVQTAKKAAEESIVLLKNSSDILPLKNVKSIAIIGPLANSSHDQMGTWVMDGMKENVITPLQSIQDEYGKKIKINYCDGLKYSRDTSTINFKAAVEAARKSDVILYFGGEESILSGEAHSLANLNLQGAQSKLLKVLHDTGKPIVFVVMAGRPLIITHELEWVDALLYAWHPGIMGGPALVDILWGKASPSGKLPVTFPKMTGQIPVYYNHFSTGRPAQKNEVLIDEIPLESKMLTIGCTSYYLDAGFDPLFPFGYGLSYTTFKYDNLNIKKDTLNTNDTISITFKLKNTGKVAATEVAQVYVLDLVGSVTRPVKELKRFERVELKPQETKLIKFSIPVPELAFYGIDMKNTVEPGEFEIMVGGNSEEGIIQKFYVRE